MENPFTLIGYVTIIGIVGGIIIGIIWGLVEKMIFEIKFRKREKEWLKNSFEWNGGRISKDFYKISNGKLEENKK